MSAGMRDKRVGGMTVASHHAIVRGLGGMEWVGSP